MLCRPEYQFESLAPTKKLAMAASACDSSPGEAERKEAWGLLLASLTEWTSSRFSERPSKLKVESE